MNNSPTKTPMRVQPPEERCNNFSEVALGYTAEEAVSEAERCLRCKNRPCTKGCPVGVAIPDFIALVREGKFGQAYEVISQASSLPAVCGRVCPQENQCEKDCVRAIKGEAVAIGGLERFVADFHAERERGEQAAERGTDAFKGKVAVVGSGPAGLACAGELAGDFDVTVFEALHATGGVLRYGIPEFRLPKRVVDREIEALEARGVKFVTNAVIGKTLSLGELQENFDAVFLGTGAGLPVFPGIKGENAKGVFSANEYLTRVNLMGAYREDSETPVFRAKRVAVIGGGNVAMDAARTARRLGAEVTVVYRRSFAELPARREEAEHAREEGVAFRLLASPKEILTDGENNVTGLSCIGMTLGGPDASGRRRPVEAEGSGFVLETEAVILALGTSPNPLLPRAEEGLKTERGLICVGEGGETSLKGVFAGGDAVTGSATVILAMGAGRAAAQEIRSRLRSLGKFGMTE